MKPVLSQRRRVGAPGHASDAKSLGAAVPKQSAAAKMPPLPAEAARRLQRQFDAAEAHENLDHAAHQVARQVKQDPKNPNIGQA